MNFISLELVRELGANFGLFAGLFAAYTLLGDWLGRLGSWRGSLVLGLVFGVAAASAMLIPVTPGEGLIFDARAPIMAMSGLFGGPLAAVVALLPAAAMRAYVGGVGAAAGIAGLVFVALISGGYHYYLGRAGRRLTMGRLWVPALMIPAAVNSSLFLFLEFGLALEVFGKIGVPLYVANFVGIYILSALLLQEERRKALWEALQASEKAAAASARAKAEFLANMSHEIRTPLNGVIGFADLLLETPMDDAQRGYLTHIRTGGRALQAVIDDILDLSKFEAGKIDLEKAPFNLRVALEEVRSILIPAAQAKKIGLELQIHPNVSEWVEGDEQRLRQILLNLLGNAVKFTERGQVSMAARVLPDGDGAERLEIRIEDTGIGIPAEHLATIFDAFVQQDASTTRRFGGSGLGLAIVRRLAGLMGGEAHVESTPGVGSTFTVRLPLAAVDAPAIEAPVDAPRPTERKGKILVAEDAVVNQELVCAMLRRGGQEPLVVSDGAAAVAAVRQDDFDLVLMDIQMPVLDGLAATEAIRAIDGERGAVPIIALTASTLEQDIAQCHVAGMNDHLAKPLDRDLLLEKVNFWLAEPRASQRATPPGEAPDASPEIDLEDVAERNRMREFIGAEEFLALERLFWEDFAERQERMRSGVDTRRVLGETAHMLVSSAGGLGYARLADHCRTIMRQADTLSADGLIAAVDTIGRTALQTRAAIKASSDDRSSAAA